jgi:purine-binding chemotaxis protein CheW
MSGTAGTIDWDAVRRQLREGAAALEGHAQPGPEAQARLLRERAAALAAPAARAATQREEAGGVEVLAFDLAGERYAFETAWVARVSPMLPLTALPGVPAFIVGVVAFEGEVLAVIDLRSLLALPVTDLADPAALVVLRGEGREFAVLAEGIAGVRSYAGAALEHRLPALAELDSSYLRGVAPDRTAVLDARRLLTDSTLVVHADRT